MTSYLGAILVAVTESTYGRQDNGKTLKPSQSLCGNCREAPNSETRPWATATGSWVPNHILNRTIIVEMRHASICGQVSVTPGTTNSATWNTASSVRTTQFQSDRPTETMTQSHQLQQRCIWVVRCWYWCCAQVVRLLNYEICMCQ